MKPFTATRAEGDAQILAFARHMGRRHVNGRDTDHKPDAQKAVSGMSTFVQYRLVLEQALLVTALAAPASEKAERLFEKAIWPYATAGVFGIEQNIPPVLEPALA